MTRRAGRRRAEVRPRPGRKRALLSLGLLLGVGATGTWAHWTEDVPITGATFTAGSLDVQVNGQDSFATTTLAVPSAVPGTTSAQLLTIKNVGASPAKYRFTGGLSGTDASAYVAAGANGIQLTVHPGGTVSGTACTGTGIATTLTATTSAELLGRRPTSPIAANGGTDPVCVQLKLADTAPTGLQGKTATVVITVVGTSDVS